MTKKPSASLVLLCIAAFLIPLIGGQLPLDRLSLGEGPGALLASIFGGAETPLFQHSIIAALVASSIVWTVVKRQVLQTPAAWVAGSLLFFGGLLVASIGYASHKGLSYIWATEWLTYGMALFAVVACVGRRGGILALLFSFFGGCTLVALIGILEVAKAEPGWRIFAGWQNPNAVAAMLVIGLILGFGLSILKPEQHSIELKPSSSEDRPRLLAMVGTALITIALYHTQSKGGFLVTALGLATTVICIAIFKWRSSGKNDPDQPPPSPVFKRGLITLVMIAVVFAGVYVAFHSKSRLGNVAESQEQSVGYRVLLWSGAKRLIAARPTGYGIGNYAPLSATTGVHPWTALTHSTFLQLVVEIGVQGIIALLAFIGAWLWYVLKGVTKLPQQSQVLLATVLGCLAATLGDNLIESNLYFFGIGMTLFMLMGAGLLIANDAVAPEYMPKGFRTTLGAVAALLVVLLGYFGIGEAVHARARFQGDAQDFAGAKSLSELAVAVAPYSSESWYLLGRNSSDLKQSIAAFRQADDLGSSPKVKSAIASRLLEEHDTKGAIETLKSAFLYDPNELETYAKIIKLQQSIGDHQGAIETAKKLVEVEKTPYLQVRALPELIETQTFEARIFLANQERDPKTIIGLLRPAVEGFAKYARITIPNVIRFAKSDPPLPYGSERLPESIEKLNEGIKAGQRLQQLYRAGGDDTDAASIDPLLDDMRKALADAVK